MAASHGSASLAAELSPDAAVVCYINSTAEVKAESDVCVTSGNVYDIVAKLPQKRILFVPDRLMADNVRKEIGNRGLDKEIISSDGTCIVHEEFTVEQIAQARRTFPGLKIVAHPECTQEVVAAADMYGSTELILKTVTEAPAGTSWGIGTEISMVRRLAAENPDKDVFCLDPVVCPCATMYRIHPAYVLWVLEGIMAGLAINRIEVEPGTRRDGLVALERMLEIGG